MMSPLSRYRAFPPKGGRTQCPGQASSTGALVWDAPFAKVSSYEMRGES